MCDLVLTLEAVCPQAPPLLRIGSNRSVTMSQKQAASLLACSFFCLFPNSSNRKQSQDADNYQNPNFDRLYANGPPQKMEKLKCILNYFRRVTEKMPNGVITFQRYMLPSKSYPSWRDSNINLGDLHLTTSKKIEEVQNTLQADFANKYIGGGVLGSGCVQEEIRFSICPEMLVSLLVCEVMEDNECIFLIGCEQYSSYRGYAHSFQFDGDYKDTTPKDNWGRKWCHLVAMDAIYFQNPSTQYNMKAIDRELIKAYTSFRPLGKGPNYEFGITTGNWGCGAFNGDKQLKAETDEKNNEKRTKTSDVSQEYDDNFEEDIDDAEKNVPDDEELSSRLSNYDEDSREGQFYEDKSSQNESSSQPIAENSEYDNVDEEDDGTYQGVPLSEITNVCQQPPTIIDMKDVCERTHTFLIKPFKYTSTDPDAEPQAFYENGTYVDEWDQNYVRLPCSQSYINKNGTQRWSIIQESLIKLQHLAETHMASMDDIKETIEECAGRSYELNCLERLLNEVYTVDERAHFMSAVLSNICTLAVNVDKICSRPPPLLRIGSNRTVTMSQKQAASLLSCAFFCLFPRRFNQKVGSEYENYQNPNFNTLFQGGRKGGTTWKLEKLKCVFHYFHRITEKMPNGVISFRRYQLPESCVPKWTESTESLCKIHITKNKTIEDMDGLLQVDFANKYIGGGVMNEGCVQEEIRFVICPEMLLSLLLCEVIQPNECIFLIGCERFSSYRGYSTSFQFKDNYIDETPKDSWGRKLCHVVAMDAIAFYNRSSQYTIKNMKRELIKAYTCFRVPAALTDPKAGIATGNWGCGAFNGNKQLKAIIQLIAASQAGRPLVYLTFRDQNLVLSFYKVYKYLLDEKATVKDLCTYLQQYTTLYNKITLFDYILETPVSSL
ncbi:unnamed protein product [Adineta steineri]|uniref:poly(ADP-ribose) glycohydrolase n=2 Tax=Adineta steineri TaxID=433720 RepID=A0A814DHJ4_9BILA|nr:unnamed protein product [Adineta steineri]